MRDYLARSRTRAVRSRRPIATSGSFSRTCHTNCARRSTRSLVSPKFFLDPSLKVTEEDQSQFLTDVLSSGKHLLGLINEILDLAKIEAGKMELQIEPALLSDVLEAVEEKHDAVAGGQKGHQPSRRERCSA